MTDACPKGEMTLTKGCVLSLVRADWRTTLFALGIGFQEQRYKPRLQQSGPTSNSSKKSRDTSLTNQQRDDQQKNDNFAQENFDPLQESTTPVIRIGKLSFP
jgi:hypothetical protein